MKTDAENGYEFNPTTPTYKVGDSPRGMIILRVTHKAREIRGWKYLVKGEACGHEQDIAHKTLMSKKRMFAYYRGLCSTCIRRRDRELDVILSISREENRDKNPSDDNVVISKKRREDKKEEYTRKGYQWASALWGLPGKKQPVPHLPDLGLINRIDHRREL